MADEEKTLKTTHEVRFHNGATGRGSAVRVLGYSDDVHLLVYKDNRYVAVALTSEEATELARRLTVAVNKHRGTAA